ncbi:MAG: hypothetical protein JXB49_02145 [Bacteroidales bacterium]|nr:hypothetical protein [Bacteroidales bacterium]
MDYKMITVDECSKTLSQNGKEYSRQEIESILEFLNNLAKVAIEDFFKRHGKGSNIHKGEHR